MKPHINSQPRMGIIYNKYNDKVLGLAHAHTIHIFMPSKSLIYKIEWDIWC